MTCACYSFVLAISDSGTADNDGTRPGQVVNQQGAAAPVAGSSQTAKQGEAILRHNKTKAVDTGVKKIKHAVYRRIKATDKRHTGFVMD